MRTMLLTVEYDIPDIHCKKCADKIALVLKYTAGVSSSEVSLENHHATVKLDPHVISGVKIKAMLVALGFSAMIL